MTERRRLEAPAAMLATAAPLPHDDDAWATEVKLDGVRVAAVLDDDGLRLRARSGRDTTAELPELAALGTAAAGRRLVLDGEAVVLGPTGVPDFGLLQHRLGRSGDRARAGAAAQPARLVAFDCLHVDGQDLVPAPWSRRREALEEVVAGLLAQDARLPLQVSPVFDDAADVLAAARTHGWEGVVVKRRDSPYRPGVRSPDWIKHRLTTTTSFLVGGWEPGEGRRGGRVGALLLGRRVADGSLLYEGQVGSGLDEADLDALAAVLPDLARDGCPFDPPPPAVVVRQARWVEPVLVVDVVDRGRTAAGLLRQPSAERLRPDLRPQDLAAAGSSAAGGRRG